MKKSIFIVANWKMNLNFSSASNLIDRIKATIKNSIADIKVIICPQFLLIPQIKDSLSNDGILSLGAQDCHHKLSGAFTGDTSIELLKDLKCQYVIVGHSERRIYHKESSETIKNKIQLINQLSMVPILCIGESLVERREKNYLDILSEQLLKSIPNEVDKLLIAYEPIWSIGSGLVPSLEQIKEVTDHIRLFVNNNKKIGTIYVLYGGSVNLNNFFDIFKVHGVSGGLIGGASMKSGDFTKILKKLI